MQNGWTECKRQLDEAREQLFALKDEKQALAREKDELKNDLATMIGDSLRTEKENKILSLKASGTLANNLCPDHRDKQADKPCLACTVETLTRENAELRKVVGLLEKQYIYEGNPWVLWEDVAKKNGLDIDSLLKRLK